MIHNEWKYEWHFFVKNKIYSLLWHFLIWLNDAQNFLFLKQKKNYKYINFVKIKKSLSKHISLIFINFWMRHKCIPSIWTTLSLINNKSFFYLHIFWAFLAESRNLFPFLLFTQIDIVTKNNVQKLLLKFGKKFNRHACTYLKVSNCKCQNRDHAP